MTADLTWHVAVEVSAAGVDLIEAALAVDADAVAVAEAGEMRRVDAWFGQQPSDGDLGARLALAAAAAGVAVPDLSIEPVSPTDWVAATHAAFPPIPIGPFLIHGSHVQPSASRWRCLKIDANVAFGTGEHPTTAGCVMALTALAKRRPVNRMLDMGCGTAILAMAAARLWPCQVLGIDIDAKSVSMARENIRENGLSDRIRTAWSNGYAGRPVRDWGRVDLVTANILARPLTAMAPDLARALRPGGHAVLAGLLTPQAPMVLAAHRAQGLALERRLVIGAWTILVLRR